MLCLLVPKGILKGFASSISKNRVNIQTFLFNTWKFFCVKDPDIVYTSSMLMGFDFECVLPKRAVIIPSRKGQERLEIIIL